MTPPIASACLDDAKEVRAIGDFLDRHEDATPFHSPAWMTAIEKAAGHRVHYLVARDGNEIAGLLPLHHVRSPFFGNALVSSAFAVAGGILADGPATAARLAEAGWRLAERLHCPSLELRSGFLPAGSGWRIERGVYAGFVKPLPTEDESLLLAIPRKQRAEIRKALATDCEVTIGTDESDRQAHYRVYSESVRNLGTPVFPRTLFAAVLDAFGERADILTVRHKGVPVASVLSLYHRGTAMPYWGGGTRQARGLRANDLLYFALMRHAMARGCASFDFGRSKAGTGAFAFKKNWGFDPKPLAYAARSTAGAAPRSINPLDPRFRLRIAAWQRLPLFVANGIGPLIARGLG